jgi:hypothetical protein
VDEYSFGGCESCDEAPRALFELRVISEMWKRGHFLSQICLFNGRTSS